MKQFKTIITGHGNFSSGIKSAIELLAGKQKQFMFLNFTADMSDQVLSAKLLELLDLTTPTIIFTDLVGGTPYKEAVKIAVKRENIIVVTGCNLGSLLESAYTQYDSLEAYAADLISITKKTAQIFTMNDTPTESVPEDGI